MLRPFRNPFAIIAIRNVYYNGSKGEIPMDAKMFCYQCQETAGGKGCTMQGVCGKKPDVAEMQDLLVYVTKGLGAARRGQERFDRDESPCDDESFRDDHEREF